MKKLTYAILIMSLSFTLGLVVVARAAVTTTQRYDLQYAGPKVLVVRNCGTGEDSWGHLRLVSFDSSRVILRCPRSGY